MTPQEAYSLLFVDSFMSALLLPIQTNLALPTMKIFGGYNPLTIAIIASLGATFAAAANWALGKAIAATLKYEPEAERAKIFVRFLVNKGHLILILSWIPVFGSVITVFLGAAGGKFKLLIPIVLVVNLIYYGLLSF